MPYVAVTRGASLLGALVIYFGPELGPWITILVASIVGSLWTVGKVATETRLIAALLWVRTILTACVLTGGLAVLIEAHVSTGLDYILSMTAFALGALGDKFEAIRVATGTRIQSWIGGNDK